MFEKLEMDELSDADTDTDEWIIIPI
jgi:hypothetical protein